VALNAKLEAIGGPVSGKCKPQPQSWMHYRIGRSYMGIGGAMNSQKKQIRAELYLQGPPAKTFFKLLNDQKAEIERELGYPLEWQELPDGQDSRIAIFLNDADPADEADWPRQHDWLAKRLNEMHRVFAPRVRDLEMA